MVKGGVKFHFFLFDKGMNVVNFGAKCAYVTCIFFNYYF